MSINMNRYLPIGTVVLLDHLDQPIMIMGRQLYDTQSENMRDYMGCLYPEGMAGNNKAFLFNHDTVTQVLHLGYNDASNIAFTNGLLAVLKEAAY